MISNRANRRCFEAGAYKVAQKAGGILEGVSNADMESFRDAYNAISAGGLPNPWCPETIVGQAAADPGLVASTLEGAMAEEDEEIEEAMPAGVAAA